MILGTRDLKEFLIDTTETKQKKRTKRKTE